MTDNNNQTVRKTTDIWFMAYLQSKGFDLIDFEVLNPGKSVFQVKISDEEWKKYKLEFHQHEVNTIRRNVEGLKDLSFLLLIFYPVLMDIFAGSNFI